MKALMILLSLVYSLFAINSVDAAFVLSFHEDYPTALVQAKEEKRFLMLVIIKDPCDYSERMVYNTLSDPEVVKALEPFVSVIVDKNTFLPLQFKVDLVPMVYFIDPKNEEIIHERMGYVHVKQFLDDIKEAHIFTTKNKRKKP